MVKAARQVGGYRVPHIALQCPSCNTAHSFDAGPGRIVNGLQPHQLMHSPPIQCQCQCSDSLLHAISVWHVWSCFTTHTAAHIPHWAHSALSCRQCNCMCIASCLLGPPHRTCLGLLDAWRHSTGWLAPAQPWRCICKVHGIRMTTWRQLCACAAGP